jgi:CxxC motif-containing protein (DUF1111 family)
MGATGFAFRSGRTVRAVFSFGVFAGVLGAPWLAATAADAAKGNVSEGQELFFREWTPRDARSHGGDGLGPVFNDTSCVACHNAGAPGGAGPKSKNVDILSAFSNRAMMGNFEPQPPGFLRRALGALVGIEPPPPQTPNNTVRRPNTRELIKAHAGFRTSRSVVMHRFGIDDKYQSWRTNMLGLSQFVGFTPSGAFVADRTNQAVAELNQIKTLAQFEDNLQFQNQAQFGEFSVSRSQRNPTALFGAGLIDSIPDSVIEAAAKVKHPGNAQVLGRVSRQKDGRIGRFGWKAQTPTLEDFVLTACAVELGLEVPGHHQGGLPQSPNEKSKGMDLNAKECASLIAYVRNLPAPSVRIPSDAPEERTLEEGKRLFSKTGCNACHTARLGNVQGIYSDLLLHDMGPDLGDTGSYGVFVPNESEPDFVDPDQPLADGPAAPGAGAAVAVADSPAGFAVVTTEVANSAPGNVGRRPMTGPASRQEWRTPPLWGFRDSGPYLHDGRAETLDQTVALHGGEAGPSAIEYFKLTTRQRLELEAFLKSLVAPGDPVAKAAE